jgi:bacterioferritin-associated ferredoxin
MATKKDRRIHQLQALRDRLAAGMRCGRCGAPQDGRGVLVLQQEVLEALDRDEHGTITQVVVCPECLQVPAAILPANETAPGK